MPYFLHVREVRVQEEPGNQVVAVHVPELEGGAPHEAGGLGAEGDDFLNAIREKPRTC